MLSSYVKLALFSLLPVAGVIFFHLLDTKTRFKDFNYIERQIYFGVFFGFLAVLGTECGVPINGAQINCRDAAVLAAGLIFGGPAGIIAGFIGGIERWIAVAWGIGSFTRVACSVSTIIAGFYSALLRKYMFENKRPSWILALATGVVMEVFHLTMVFVTNIKTPLQAMEVVKACTFPMVTFNGLSVMFSAASTMVISKEKFFTKNSDKHISYTIQQYLLLSVIGAFAVTTLFMFNFQNQLAQEQAKSLLTLSLSDVKKDIEEASDNNLAKETKNIASLTESESVEEIARQLGVPEISIVDKYGYITESTNPEYKGFNMFSGDQASEFAVLLYGGIDSFVQEYGPISYDSSVYMKYAGAKLPQGGFVQVGYDAEHFQKDLTETINIAVKNRHIGSSGYLMVLDNSMNIVSSPSLVKSDLKMLKDIKEGEMFRAFVGGDWNLCMYSVSEGFIIVAVIPEKEAMQVRNIAMYVNSFMEILVFGLLFITIFFLVKAMVVDKITKVNEGLARISEGKLDTTIDVETNLEFKTLSNDINQTVGSLRNYIAEAEARIDKELIFAKNIQTSVLPRIFPKRRSYEVYAQMDTAKEVGGDFYDFYYTDRYLVNILIADVSGKGIPAAMFMMRSKAELKALADQGNSIDAVFTKGNEALCDGNDAGMFVTAWQGTVNLETGEVSFANAGHNPPLIRHNGKYEYLNQKAGLVLAGMDGIIYKKQTLQLEPGDIIFLYTDGITEATNSSNELYGEQRLLDALNARSDMNVTEEICKYIKSEVDNFVAEAPQFDDMTMLCFRFDGQNA